MLDPLQCHSGESRSPDHEYLRQTKSAYKSRQSALFLSISSSFQDLFHSLSADLLADYCALHRFVTLVPHQRVDAVPPCEPFYQIVLVLPDTF